MMTLIKSPNILLATALPRVDTTQVDIASIALQMTNLMHELGGLGLSANQVGLPYQIFVMRTVLNKQYGNVTVVINPVVKSVSKQIELGPEGCLSHTDLFLSIKRPNSINVEFDTLTSDYNSVISVDATYDDIDARCFLHEYDHLQGIQFVDRVSKLKLKIAQTAQTARTKRIKYGRT